MKERERKKMLRQFLEILKDDDVEWVVNEGSELGVKIGNRFFFLYKGMSLEYTHDPDNEDPMQMWRHVWKREFGECCHPWHFIKQRTGEYRIPDNYPAVDGSSGGDWKRLPKRPPA